MHQAVLLWVEYAKHRVGYVSGLSILEVGSANWNGSPRHLFTDAKHYTGIDIHPAKDVDLVLSSYDMSAYFGEQMFDLVLYLEVLEHDPHPNITMSEIYRLLRPMGACIITAAAPGRPYHDDGTRHYRNISLSRMSKWLEPYSYRGIEVGLNEAGTPDIRAWGIRVA